MNNQEREELIKTAKKGLFKEEKKWVTRAKDIKENYIDKNILEFPNGNNCQKSYEDCMKRAKFMRECVLNCEKIVDFHCECGKYVKQDKVEECVKKMHFLPKNVETLNQYWDFTLQQLLDPDLAFSLLDQEIQIAKTMKDYGEGKSMECLLKNVATFDIYAVLTAVDYFYKDSEKFADDVREYFEKIKDSEEDWQEKLIGFSVDNYTKDGVFISSHKKFDDESTAFFKAKSVKEYLATVDRWREQKQLEK